MQANYTLWLNGNSLVFIDDTVSVSRSETLLNIQLAAYLTANKGHAIQDDEWHRNYLRVQSNFGCTIVNMQSRPVAEKNATACEPWQILRANLLTGVPSTLREPLAQCLDAYPTQSDGAIEQLLAEECIRPPDDKGMSHVRIELRLILADSSIISTELGFSTAGALTGNWLRQPLTLASDQSTQQFDAHYQTDEKVIHSISAGLHDSIKVKQLQYRSQIKPVVALGVEHE
ncbi:MULTISPECIES: hypothetical protein [Pseudomonas]|uniref:hypothetical protein n=1 Tax=Pseudomonas TaxID=286 RepID=UPI002456E80C|nr:hypothetical protein [Pseudomonas sp. BN607]MDH4553236.1 hypothetical protein [Pseudomonas sp. BN607]